MDQQAPTLAGLKRSFEHLDENLTKDLARKDELGAMSFEFLGPRFDQLRDMVQELRALPLEQLPQQRIDNLADVAVKVNQRLTEIRHFNVQSNPISRRGEVEHDFLAALDDLFVVSAPLVAYLKTSQSSVSEMRRSLQDLARPSTDRIASLETQAQAALASIRDAAAAAGVSRHAGRFELQAAEHQSAAKAWLIATISLIVVGLVATAFVLRYYLSDAALELSASRVIQLTTAKILFASLLYFVVIWSARNYRAHRHNYVLAKHRANALGTFESFVQGTADDATKNAILLRATEAAFGQAISGYMQAEPEPSATSHVVEIIKTTALQGSK